MRIDRFVRVACLAVLTGNCFAADAVPLNDRVFPEEIRRWCVPTEQLGARAAHMDEEALRRAAATAEGWARAVIHPRHLAGVKIEFVAYTDLATKADLLRGTFESADLRFEMTQSPTQIAVVATERSLPETLAMRTAEFDAHLRQVIPSAFNHPGALLLLLRVAHPVKGGLVARMSDTGYDRQGIPMPFEDFQRLESLPPADRDRKRSELTAALLGRVKEADVTIPRDAVGAVQDHWWGRVLAATNGRSMVLVVEKSRPDAKQPTVALETNASSASDAPGASAPLPWVPRPSE